jgi:hypothetical protein
LFSSTPAYLSALSPVHNRVIAFARTAVAIAFRGGNTLAPSGQRLALWRPQRRCNIASLISSTSAFIFFDARLPLCFVASSYGALTEHDYDSMHVLSDA